MDKRFPLADQIAMFSASLKGRVIVPGHADYDGTRALALGNFDHRPALLVRVANAADVAGAITFARAADLPLAIRSGGHGIGGHGSAEGGLVIDLRDLNGLVIDADAQALWAGTGLTSGDVTRAVEQHGFIIGFGDSATVGIGGLTLGGGIGFLVRKHGLTIDSLLAAEVVTASGDIVIADEIHHPDLFWALRGGGGNFGVVTRLKYRLHPLPHFTGGIMVLPATPETLARFVAAAEAAPEELSTIAVVMPAPPMPFLPHELHGKTIILGMMAFAGDAFAAHDALAPFRALQTLADLVRPAPFSSMYLPEDPGMKPSVSCRCLFMDEFGLPEAQKVFAAMDAAKAPMPVAQIRVLGGAAARVPTGATAFAHRQSRVMVAFLAMSGGPQEAAEHDIWAGNAVSSLRCGDARAYVNFVGLEGENGLRAAYPSETWERLRQVKGRYDPENLFRLNQNIPPA